MCQMCHVPLMFAMTKHMHHIWGGSSVETVDLKKLEDAVLSDLETIKKLTVQVFEQIFGDYNIHTAASNFVYLFDGVMSLDDFANFVYFSYFSGLYMRNEPKKSVYEQFRKFLSLNSLDRRSKINAKLSDEEFEKFSNSWPFGKKAPDVRGTYNCLNELVNAKSLPRDIDFEEEMWKAIRNVAEYKVNSNAARRQGIPIGKSLFYQNITQYKLNKQNQNVFYWMTSTRTRTDGYIKFYTEFFFFLKMWMIDNSSVEELLSNESLIEIRERLRPKYLKADKVGLKKCYEEKCKSEYETVIAEREDRKETYIARAINLETLEGGYRFLLILDFALALNKEGNQHFKLSQDSRRFWLSCLPPHFFIQAPPKVLASLCSNRRSRKIFTQISACFDNNLGRKYQVPVCMFDRYSEFFLAASSSHEAQEIEEYRYYTILYLACIIINFLANKELEMQYSHDKFIWFIDNKYNIFKIYKDKINMNIGKVITAPVANNLRKIAKEIVGK